MDIEKGNIFESVQKFFDKAVDLGKNIKVIGDTLDFSYISFTVDASEVEIIDNPFCYLYINSGLLCSEIELNNKMINISDDDYLYISNKDNSTEYVISII